MMKRLIPVAILALAAMLALAVPRGALAVGGSSGTIESEPDFRDARVHIANQRYEAAIKILLQLRQEYVPTPEIPNWIAYSYRKLKDYPTSKRFYDEALELDPNFLPALEHQGEWFIETGDMASARANLEKLAKLCGRCHEWEDLDKAIRAAEGK